MHRPIRRTRECREQREQRRLSRSVWAEQADHATGFDRQAHLCERALTIEDFADIACLDAIETKRCSRLRHATLALDGITFTCARCELHLVEHVGELAHQLVL